MGRTLSEHEAANGYRYCNKCRLRKPLVEFGKEGAIKFGNLVISSRCKQCIREKVAAYLKTPAGIASSRRSSSKHSKRKYQELRFLLEQYISSHPCVDCGESDPCVLEFDHANPLEKVDCISRMVGKRKPWVEIEAEIAKCQVRCANCHKRRHHRLSSTIRVDEIRGLYGEGI